MVIKRRGTPTTVQLKEQLTVLGSLSAWTDNDEDEKPKRDRKDGYKALEDDAEAIAEADMTKFQLYIKPLMDVESNNFNMLIGVVILANALTIGFETDYGRDKFIWLEHLFNGCFFIEMVMRVFQLRLEYFYEMWNLFDLTLVITGSLDLWILPFFSAEGKGLAPGVHGLTSLRLLRMIRILRLMRVLRVVRLFRMFRQLFLIMQAFAKAFQVVLIVSVFIVILIYSYSIILTQMVGHRAAEWGDNESQILHWFGTIPASMRTMFFIMTLTDWDTIPMTLIQVLPALPVMFGFVSYILVSSYTMVSLITGIIGESLISSQQDFKHKKLMQIEESRGIIVGELMSFIGEILEDSITETGKVPVDELKQSVRGDQELQQKLIEIQIQISDKAMALMIDNMAVEENGQTVVHVAHFVDKLCYMTGDAKGQTVMDVKHIALESMKRVDRLEKKMDTFAKEVVDKLDRIVKKQQQAKDLTK